MPAKFPADHVVIIAYLIDFPSTILEQLLKNLLKTLHHYARLLAGRNGKPETDAISITAISPVIFLLCSYGITRASGTLFTIHSPFILQVPFRKKLQLSSHQQQGSE